MQLTETVLFDGVYWYKNERVLSAWWETQFWLFNNLVERDARKFTLKGNYIHNDKNCFYLSQTGLLLHSDIYFIK